GPCAPDGRAAGPRTDGAGRSERADAADHGASRLTGAVAAPLGLREGHGDAVGLGRAGPGPAGPGEEQRVLTLEEAVRPHATGAAALARVLREGGDLPRARVGP